MFSMISFLPVLALLAFMSVEVTADATTPAQQKSLLAFSGLADNLNEFKIAIKPMQDGKMIEPCAEAAGCTSEPLMYDQGSIEVTLTGLPPKRSGAFATSDNTDGTPSKIVLAQCFDAADQANRKWRAFADVFEKNKACQFKPEPFDYPEDGGRMVETISITDTQPTATYTITAFVVCEDQPEFSFCSVTNAQPWADDIESRQPNSELFYRVEVWNSRPTSLWVAALVCAAIGPILLIAFLIYERGVLAKQA